MLRAWQVIIFQTTAVASSGAVAGASSWRIVLSLKRNSCFLLTTVKGYEIVSETEHRTRPQRFDLESLNPLDDTRSPCESETHRDPQETLLRCRLWSGTGMWGWRLRFYISNKSLEEGDATVCLRFEYRDSWVNGRADSNLYSIIVNQWLFPINFQ